MTQSYIIDTTEATSAGGTLWEACWGIQRDEDGDPVWFTILASDKLTEPAIHVFHRRGEARALFDYYRDMFVRITDQAAGLGVTADGQVVMIP